MYRYGPTIPQRVKKHTGEPISLVSFQSWGIRVFFLSLNTRNVPVATQRTAGLYLHFSGVPSFLVAKPLGVIREQCFPVYVSSPRNSRETYSTLDLFVSSFPETGTEPL